MDTQDNTAIDQGARIVAVYTHNEDTASSCRAYDIMLAADALDLRKQVEAFHQSLTLT